VVARGRRQAAWALDLHSAVPVDSVEIIVNGRAVARLDGTVSSGSRRYEGQVRLPAGGWIAARALGGPTVQWPAMDSYGFAHTAPIWIVDRGSTVPEVRRAAAADLLAALEVAERRLREAYAGTPIPHLEAQFRRARERLEAAGRE
jgi:TolB protein